MIEPSDKKEPKKKGKEKKKLTNEELDALGEPEEYIEDFDGLTPSIEQTRAINAVVRADVDTAIDALAGAGKTTTLLGITRALAREKPKARVLILVFNRKNADETKAKLRGFSNADARTTHSVAYGAMTKNQKNATNKKYKGVAVSDKQVAEALEMDDTPLPGEIGNLSATKAAAVVKRAVSKFANSDDKEVQKKHVDAAFMDLYGDDLPEGWTAPEKFLSWTKAMWADISSDRPVPVWDKDKKEWKNVPKETKPRIWMTPDHYLKLWSLSDPDLTKLTINGEPVSHVFFDEAQDTNPTVASVLTNNRGKLRLAYVGDPNQAIYGWRGAVNFLEEAKVESEAVADLTVTRRFSDRLATVGNAFLNLLGSRTRIRGVGTEGEILPDNELPEGPSTAHIVRTNYGGFDAIMSYVAQGKTVAALSVFYTELEAAIYTLKWLQEDFSTRTPRPQTPDGREVDSDDFAGISSMKDLREKAESDPKSRAARWLDILIQKGGGDIGPLEEVLKGLVVDRSDLGSLSAAENVDASTGASGVLWISPTTKVLEYSIDENGKIEFFGSAMFEQVGGEKRYMDHLKKRGWKFNGVTKRWTTQGNTDEERQEIISEVLNVIPNRIPTEDPRTPDVIVTTAHRAKGLEWDNVQIGEDFPNPNKEVDGKIVFTVSDEELKTYYVATTRAKKRLALGSLAWARDYEGRDGLVKANRDQERPTNFGAEAWDYHESQGQGLFDRQFGENTSYLLSTKFNGEIGFFEEDDELPSGTGPISAPPSSMDVQSPRFTDSWAAIGTRGNQYSKSVDGFRWEITENRDGTATLRPRTNPDLGTQKYDSLDALAADFDNQAERGRESNRQALKDTLSPIDEDGSLAELIDSGASSDEIADEISKREDYNSLFEDDSPVNPLSLAAALSRANAGRDVITVKRTRSKPKEVKPKPFVPDQSEQRAKTIYDSVPTERQDDGEEIDGSPLSDDEFGGLARLLKASKVPDVIAGVLRINPNAKVAPDGSIVYFRKTAIEKGGPADGKAITTEIRIKDNKGNDFNVIVEVTDEEGNKQTYYHYSRHHSLGSLIGKRTSKSAGVERLLYQYFNRDVNENPYPTEQDERLYSGVMGAIDFLRPGSAQNLLANKNKSDTSLKLRTPQEHAALALNGRARILNSGTKNWATQQRKQRESIFDAIENNDSEATLAFFRQYMTSIPDTPEARKAAKDYLLGAIERKFSELDPKQMSDFLDEVEALADANLPPIGTPVGPHLDKNGVPIKPGSVIRWTNNVGVSSVGVVETPIRIDNPNDGSYSYSDYVLVNFPNREKPVRLNSKNMEVVPNDTPITEYTGKAKKDDLKIIRLVEAGYGFDSERGIFYDKHDGNVIDALEGVDLNQYKGVDARKLPSVSRDPNLPALKSDPSVANNSKKAGDIEQGDTIFDPEGRNRGKVTTARKGKKKGLEVIAVETEDGYREVYEVNEDVNIFDGSLAPASPASRSSKKASDISEGEEIFDDQGNSLGKVTRTRRGKNKSSGEEIVGIETDSGYKALYALDEDVATSTGEGQAPEGETGAPRIGELGAAAREAGLGSGRGKGPTRTISKNNVDPDDPQKTAKIKGRRKGSQFAVKPTEEARTDVKTLKDLGQRAWDKVKPRIIQRLREEGYDIPEGADFDDFQKFEAAELASLRAPAENKKTAEAEVRNAHETMKKSMNASRQRQGLDALIDLGFAEENGNIDSEKLYSALIDADLRPLAYEVRREGNLESRGANSQLLSKYAGLILSGSATDVADSLRKLYQEQNSARKANFDARRRHDRFADAIRRAEGDETKRVLEEEGVEFDNVSYLEFDGRILSDDARLPFRPEDTFLSAEALQEAFDYLPRSWILALADHLKATGKKLYVKAGVRRGHFKEVKGGYEIHLSGRSRTRSDKTKVTDTALHELGHFLQKVLPNMRQLEHGYTYDRLVQNEGTEDEQLPNIMTVPGARSSELTFAAPGLAEPYTFKQYNRRDGRAFLNPNDDASELTTTVLQDLFTAPGSMSRGRTIAVIVKGEDGRPKVIANAFYDPETGTWYTNRDRKNMIEESSIKGVYGRSAEDGVDQDLKSYGLGLFLMLNDWSPTEGFGPGNAVTTPETLQSLANKPSSGKSRAWKTSELDELADNFIRLRQMNAAEKIYDSVMQQSESIQQKFWKLVEAKDAARQAEEKEN